MAHTHGFSAAISHPFLDETGKNCFISLKQHFIIFIDFFPSVGKIFFDFFCHFPFSLQVIHLLSPPSSGGCLPIACFTERRFSSKSSSTFFLHHLNYEYVFYSINICHNVMFPKLPFLLVPVYHGKQDTQRIYVISSLLAGLLWAVTGTFIVSTLCC